MGSLRVGHDWTTFTFHLHALEKEMAPHSSVLAWRIPGTGEPGGLPSMGSHRVGHDWRDLAAAAVAAAVKRWAPKGSRLLFVLHCGWHQPISFWTPLGRPCTPHWVRGCVWSRNPRGTPTERSPRTPEDSLYSCGALRAQTWVQLPTLIITGSGILAKH